MKFLLDESVDLRLAAYLRSIGHDVTVVSQDYQPSIPDHQVLALAHQEERILITNDKDFGELVFALNQPFSGVILLRLGTFEIAPTISRLDYVLQQHTAQLNQFLVVTPRSVRVRSRA